MDRSRYALDLLRPGITVDNELQHMLRKRELTQDDYDLITASADAVKEAAILAQQYSKK